MRVFYGGGQEQCPIYQSIRRMLYSSIREKKKSPKSASVTHIEQYSNP